ncbi:hypothetical protein cyc_07901 [Cyclospora cayetanensis]|uniref:Uncharacterized protein n=1 Tax=Cyclospora cayetanensis TaxID=88456 RepID=A0A1D3CYR3_9EIME|nr:hypothetical protein cyc_07901 [Cyclospora cayetanensis]
MSALLQYYGEDATLRQPSETSEHYPFFATRALQESSTADVEDVALTRRTRASTQKSSASVGPTKTSSTKTSTATTKPLPPLRGWKEVEESPLEAMKKEPDLQLLSKAMEKNPLTQGDSLVTRLALTLFAPTDAVLSELSITLDELSNLTWLPRKAWVEEMIVMTHIVAPKLIDPREITTEASVFQTRSEQELKIYRSGPPDPKVKGPDDNDAPEAEEKSDAPAAAARPERRRRRDASSPGADDTDSAARRDQQGQPHRRARDRAAGDADEPDDGEEPSESELREATGRSRRSREEGQRSRRRDRDEGQRSRREDRDGSTEDASDDDDEPEDAQPAEGRRSRTSTAGGSPRRPKEREEDEDNEDEPGSSARGRENDHDLAHVEDEESLDEASSSREQDIGRRRRGRSPRTPTDEQTEASTVERERGAEPHRSGRQQSRNARSPAAEERRRSHDGEEDNESDGEEEEHDAEGEDGTDETREDTPPAVRTTRNRQRVRQTPSSSSSQAQLAEETDYEEDVEPEDDEDDDAAESSTRQQPRVATTSRMPSRSASSTRTATTATRSPVATYRTGRTRHAASLGTSGGLFHRSEQGSGRTNNDNDVAANEARNDAEDSSDPQESVPRTLPLFTRSSAAAVVGSGSPSSSVQRKRIRGGSWLNSPPADPEAQGNHEPSTAPSSIQPQPDRSNARPHAQPILRQGRLPSGGLQEPSMERSGALAGQDGTLNDTESAISRRALLNSDYILPRRLGAASYTTASTPSTTLSSSSVPSSRRTPEASSKAHQERSGSMQSVQNLEARQRAFNHTAVAPTTALDPRAAQTKSVSSLTAASRLPDAQITEQNGAVPEDERSHLAETNTATMIAGSVGQAGGAANNAMDSNPPHATTKPGDASPSTLSGRLNESTEIRREQTRGSSVQVDQWSSAARTEAVQSRDYTHPNTARSLPTTEPGIETRAATPRPTNARHREGELTNERRTVQTHDSRYSVDTDVQSLDMTAQAT